MLSLTYSDKKTSNLYRNWISPVSHDLHNKVAGFQVFGGDAYDLNRKTTYSWEVLCTNLECHHKACLFWVSRVNNTLLIPWTWQDSGHLFALTAHKYCGNNTPTGGGTVDVPKCCSSATISFKNKALVPPTSFSLFPALCKRVYIEVSDNFMCWREEWEKCLFFTFTAFDHWHKTRLHWKLPMGWVILFASITSYEETDCAFGKFSYWLVHWSEGKG